MSKEETSLPLRCTTCHSYAATEQFGERRARPKPETPSEAPVGRSETRSQNNTIQGNSEEINTPHFYGLTSLEGSTRALLIVPVKIKVKGSPCANITHALFYNGSNATFRSFSLLERPEIGGKKTRLAWEEVKE